MNKQYPKKPTVEELRKFAEESGHRVLGDDEEIRRIIDRDFDEITKDMPDPREALGEAWLKTHPELQDRFNEEVIRWVLVRYGVTFLLGVFFGAWLQWLNG